MRKRTGTIDSYRTTTGEVRFRLRVTSRGARKTIDTFGTEAEAVAVQVASADALEEADTDAHTVATWIARWLTQRDRARVVVDTEGERSRYEQHIEGDRIGRIKLHALRRGDVLDWAARLRAKRSASTTRNTLGVLRQALQAALDEERVQANVAAGVKVRGEKRTTDPWTFLDLAEQGALLRALPEPERWIAAFAMGTGLRAGELVALRAADIADGSVTVRYGGPPDKPTKSGRVRVVPLLGLAAEAVRHFRHDGANPLGLAFPRARGGYRDPAHVIPWAMWVDAAKAAGITRNLRWHDLRHTCASALVSGMWGAPWSIELVRGMLGHTDIRTTQRYAHLSGTALAAAGAQSAMNWPEARSAMLGKHAESWAPPARIELATNGLGTRWKSRVITPERHGSGRIAANCRAALRAIGEGRPEAVRLATDALEEAVVALEVQALRVVS